ncbi:MAG: hypothetical protein RL398_664, partial [Planctomycetota bacterium]
MTTLAVVELEEGALAFTVAEQRGRRIVASHTSYVPSSESTPAALGSALAALRAEHLPEGALVHVVLGDRRIQHHRLEVPVLPVADLQDMVRREAMRVTSVASIHEVLIGLEPVRWCGRGKLRLAFTAMPKSV